MINTIKAVWSDLIRYVWPLTKRNNAIRAGLIVVAIIATGFFIGSSNNGEEILEDSLPVVYVGDISKITAADGSAFVGTVKSVSEASIQSELAGQITSVNVTVGQQIRAGAVVATLENASERAAVLQAEGAYEAAEASAALSEISVDDAKINLDSAHTSAVNTYRSAYNTANSVVRNYVDVFFSNPNGQLPGVRIDASTTYLNNTRIELQTILSTWQERTTTLSANDNVIGALNNAADDLELIGGMIDVLITATSENRNDTVNGQPASTYTSGLTTARGTINTTQSSIDSTLTSIESAEEALRTAEIGGTDNPQTSASNAQIKQARAALLSAQANLAKTILRSPISGTINMVDISVGDFISGFTPLVAIANNEALEITIYVGEQDRDTIAVGDTVTIAGTAKGVITSIAPAVDPITLKTEVKIGTDDTSLINGDTVTVTRSTEQISTSTPTVIQVPITAVKFSATDGVVFTVQDGVVTPIPVTLGPVSGSLVTINEGIDANTQFIFDARGLSAGQKVETAAIN